MCRAQNAQICSANIFPNAEIANLHCAQKHKCNFLRMSQFCLCTNLQIHNLFFMFVCKLILQFTNNLQKHFTIYKIKIII